MLSRRLPARMVVTGLPAVISAEYRGLGLDGPGAGWGSAGTDQSAHSRRFPSEASTPAAVHAFVGDTLAAIGLENLGEMAALLAAELAHNVVAYVGSSMSVRIVHKTGVLRVEVDDSSTTRPWFVRPQPFVEPRRGLQIVDRLADRWGIDVRDDGKVVWFELDVER